MNKIAKRMVRKDGTVSSRYEDAVARVMDKILSGEKKARIHYSSWTGTRGHMKLDSILYKYLDVAEALGLKYTLGNDAPRGGAEGDYIEMRFDGRNSAVRTIRAKKEDIALIGRHIHIMKDNAISLFNDIIKGKQG